MRKFIFHFGTLGSRSLVLMCRGHGSAGRHLRNAQRERWKFAPKIIKSSSKEARQWKKLLLNAKGCSQVHLPSRLALHCHSFDVQNGGSVLKLGGSPAKNPQHWLQLLVGGGFTLNKNEKQMLLLLNFFNVNVVLINKTSCHLCLKKLTIPWICALSSCP